MIPYGRQSLDQHDIDAVIEVLNSDWLTQGPLIDRFENAVADYCGAKHAVAVCNGTAALHIACLALDLGKNDILWTSPNTFTASANCALYCGATVDFVDIDPETFNLSVPALEKKLKLARQENKLPKIVIPVHFAGQSCDMQKIKSLADEYGFKIIEDACHAVGGNYHDDKVGFCAYSDMTIFSFHPVKIVTTGEGGMILTNNDKLQQKLKILRTHGITRDPADMMKEKEGDWYYQQIDLGFNYRITDIQAALGLSQMNKIDEFVKKRNELAKKYDEAFKDLPVHHQKKLDNVYSAYHLYVVNLDLDKINKTRKEIFDELRAAGVGVHVHYIPVHTQPCYQQRGFKYGDFPNAEKYYEKALTLPLYPGLSDEEQNYVISKIREVLT